jgi:glutamyl-tRNA reductase
MEKLTMDFSNVNTSVVCGHYTNGQIDAIPQKHLNRMLHALTHQMKKNSKAGEHDPAVNAYIDSCLSDIPMMIDRYIHITFKNRASV